MWNLRLANTPPPDHRRNFEPFATDNDVQTVVIPFHGGAALVPLMVLLARDPDWAIVYVGAGDIIFIRRTDRPLTRQSRR